MNFNQARDSFRDLLCTSLIGPGSDPDSPIDPNLAVGGQWSHEQLGDYPLRRYYSAVLFPAPAVREAQPEQLSGDEDAAEAADPSDFVIDPDAPRFEVDEADGPIEDKAEESSGGRLSDSDDVDSPVANQFFPSSMGLTACVPEELTEVEVEVELGLYTKLLPTDAAGVERIRVRLPARNLYDDLLAVPGIPARLREVLGYDDAQQYLYLRSPLVPHTAVQVAESVTLMAQVKAALRQADRQPWLPIFSYLYRLMRPCWQRYPYRCTLVLPLGSEQVTTELPLTDLREATSLPPDGGAITAALHLKQVQREGRRYVKVLLANTSPFRPNRIISTDDELNGCCFFQTALTLRVPAIRAATLLPHRAPAEQEHDAEAKQLTYQYQEVHSYGQGHSCAVHWDLPEPGKNPTALCTTFLPEVLVPGTSTELDPADDPTRLAGRVGQLRYLSVWHDENQTDDQLIDELHDFVGLYAGWHSQQQDQAGAELPAIPIIANQQEAIARLRESVELLRQPTVMTSFRLANTAMLMQMILSDDPAFGKKEKSLVEAADCLTAYGSALYTSQEVFEQHPGRHDGLDAVGQPRFVPFSYRPFQLAFLLLNLPSIVQPTHPDRQRVDLLWFPTGGGKTEAYLALTAFTILWRRLTHPDNGGGVAVLMRYTLRLLTAQQFERAARLICALEFLRREDSRRREYGLGKDRIAIGMWVGGSTTPNRLEDAQSKTNEIARQLTKAGSPEGCLLEARRKNVFAISACPWCGSRLIDQRPTGQLVHGFSATTGTHGRFTVACQNTGCAFGPAAPLPIDVVDDSLYQQPPALLFGTVDKFAQLAHGANGGRLFGRRAERGETPQLPPDLIIQDELHLLNGPLGSVVGLFETAVELLATRQHEGQTVAPKIVASTATTRNTAAQVRALYGQREVAVFPPAGLRQHNSFFARAVPGQRKHIGLMPTGKTGPDTQVRVLATLLVQRAMLLQAVHGQVLDWHALVDNYWTLVVYFNNLKDLGKTKNQMGAEVAEYLRGLHQRYHLDPFQYSFAHYRLEQRTSELTSRISSAQIKQNLDALARQFPTTKPYRDSVSGRTLPYLETVDVVLASNMLSVGIDVARFNLMLMVGQPKNVAEYIQASSRAARQKPGLVVNLLNPNRAREKSYFENYTAFNQAYYKAVEPLTATPYTTVTVDKALNLVLVAYVRHRAGGLPRDQQAGEFSLDMLAELRTLLTQRIPPGPQADYAQASLTRLAASWQELAEAAYTNGQPLSYKDSLLRAPTDDSEWAMMTSLREVDTTSVVQTTPYFTY